MRLAILLLAALPATATVVTLQRDGTPAAGEVCRFRAADGENPFRRWLSSQELTCVAAGTDIEFPAGPWNVFGRIGGTAITDPVLVDKAPPSLALSLQPAATLITTRSGIVYAPRRAIAYPLSARTTVPAGEELWLLVVEKFTPVALFSIAALEAGTERNADGSGTAISGLLAWLQVPEEHRTALAGAHGVTAPHVYAGSRNADPLPPLPLLNGAFVLVRNVAAGDVELNLGGRSWLGHVRRAIVGTNSVTSIVEPLLARGSADVIIHWSADRNVPELDQSLGSCNDAGDRPPQYEVTTSRCAGDGDECTTTRKDTFRPDIHFGSFTIDGISSGRYRVEVRYGKLPAVSTNVVLAPFETRDARVSLGYLEVYGSLTRGGEPLGKDAVLELPGGIGFASASTGEYRAVILRPFPRESKIEIATCDRELRALVLTDQPVRPRSRFDIDIPYNRLILEVTDTFTREALRGAAVRYSIMSNDRPVLTRTATTDSDGRITLNAVPPRTIEASVSLSGYERHQVQPFTMPKTGEELVEVQLLPVRGTHGRLRSSRAFENASIYWFSAAGRMLERAEVAPDGTFTFATPHAIEETMSVVSSSHPLWVRRSPAIDLRGNVELPFPDAPGRAFDVMIARGASHISMIIGGVSVPWAVLRDHQELRGVRMGSPGSTRVPFRDIAETGRIELYLGTYTGSTKPVLPGVNLITFQ